VAKLEREDVRPLPGKNWAREESKRVDAVEGNIGKVVVIVGKSIQQIVFIFL